MITFMLGVLGSTIFWVVYVAISIFMTIFIIKNFGKKHSTYSYIALSTKSKPKLCQVKMPWNTYYGTSRPIDTNTKLTVFLAFLIYAATWPVFICAFIIVWIIRLVVLSGAWTLLEKAFDNAPNVSIEINPQKEREEG